MDPRLDAPDADVVRVPGREERGSWGGVGGLVKNRLAYV